MVQNYELQKKLIENFLINHFRHQKVKINNKWTRVFIGYDNNMYNPSNLNERLQLKNHMRCILSEVFGANETIIEIMVNKFI